jgi:hypothetical protein
VGLGPFLSLCEGIERAFLSLHEKPAHEAEKVWQQQRWIICADDPTTSELKSSLDLQGRQMLIA